MHYSRSETTRELFDKNVERKLYGNLSVHYNNSHATQKLDGTNDYAKLAHSNCSKFFDSESVHTWLSQWNLNRPLMNFSGHVVEMADAAVQCSEGQIENEALPNYCHHQPSTSTSSSEKSEDEEYPDQFFFVAGKGLGQQPLLLKETSRRGLGSSDIRCCKLKGKPRPSMVNYYAFNSSINTQTTDTQTSEMDFYRRSSYLELYGIKKAQELEEMERRERRDNGENNSSSYRNFFSCFCCRNWKNQKRKNNSLSSDSMNEYENGSKNSKQPSTKSSTDQSYKTRMQLQDSRPTGNPIVKRLTITCSSS